MASISLPRVLHPRKTSLEIERENFEKAQSQALQKAINGQECPVKQKHVRSAIIGTFQTQSAKIFWAYALRLPSLDDRIVAWKLCHVVHKILREGHPLCLVDSQRHRKELDEIGKLWGHLREGYGKMIKLYTALLINKLEFHRRNPRFPGHLGVTPDELESIGGNDVNNIFDMTIEMFDYLDHILALQEAVFGSLNMARSNSMTSAGQCRLAPLIPCIQDASKLYDYSVKLLFRLHSTLPADILAGHRERFLKQFRALKKFYESTSNLQYFKDLIAIPPLPEKPPNFLIMGDLRDYVTQEVVVPQEPEHEEEPIQEETLIDTTDDSAQDSNKVSFVVHQEILEQREFLKMQCEKLRGEINALMSKNQKDITLLKDKISSLEHDLALKESELEHEKHIKEDLLNQSFAVAQSQDSEQKQFHEKFDKLKAIYVKLRDEHVAELRKKAEVEKKLSIALRTVEKMTELEAEKDKLEMSEKQKSDELASLIKDKELFNMETEILKKSVADACKEKDSIERELQSVLEEKEELRKKSEELSYKLLELERQIDNEQKKLQASLESIVRKSIENNEETLSNAIHEVDNPAITALTCSPDYLRSLTKGCQDVLQESLTLIFTDYESVITLTNKIAHRHSVYILNGRATGNTSPDIAFGEKMADSCKILGEVVLRLLQSIKENQSTEVIVKEAVEKLEEIVVLGENINMSLLGEKAENLVDMLESEMASMDKAIEEAANKIQEMLTNSRAADSGIKLEVNEKILDTCTSLMQAIRLLVKKSRVLQAEIVSQGRGTASDKDFYKRNHQWTDGFISAAKAVAVAAKFLLTAADKVVTSNGKLEQLVVAAQEIGASTAQLVVASRVKADRNSENLKQLTQASKGVTTATGTVVATVKDCSQLIEEREELDVSNLSLHQAKRMEMEVQVRVLELEKELEQERYKLSKLRKHHYQLSGESDT
ncbi:huntingtin-interacting protein 1-like isoform X1 [Sitophilus oryzae]|uniref:Huntingtin-interacting protein 1-like isoform X1 n=1 Tax=Sitophilus oryzae TaxID=7048 RepID=A0A6J2YFH6_SITOR|nr:huntingtin-interacting protein 1-like isoform X1 [Sitophilus oryzae]